MGFEALCASRHFASRSVLTCENTKEISMADTKDSKTLEMRVAELEDKLAQLHISEEEMKTYQKVASKLGAAAPCEQCTASPCIAAQHPPCIAAQQQKPCVAGPESSSLPFYYRPIYYRPIYYRPIYYADCIPGCAPGGGATGGGGGFGGLGM